jgi:hypothetical protein
MCYRSCHDALGEKILKINLPDSFRHLLQTSLIDTKREANIALPGIAEAISRGGDDTRFVQ